MNKGSHVFMLSPLKRSDGRTTNAYNFLADIPDIRSHLGGGSSCPHRREASNPQNWRSTRQTDFPRCLGTKTSKQFTNVVIRFLRFRGPMDIGKVCDTLRSETAEHRSACQIRLASAIIFRFQFQGVASACRSVPSMWEPPPAAYKIACFRISRIDTMSRRKRSETSNGGWTIRLSSDFSKADTQLNEPTLHDRHFRSRFH